MDLKMMWTSNTKDSVSANGKEKENSRVVTFPPIPKSCSNSQQDLNNRKQPTFQRLQELFFASGQADNKQDAHHRLDSRMTNKRAEGHWNGTRLK
ncbi:hypothetical protein SKAU_G00038530 [Synaphobranchus kaupii]|uniref:Uncharacterized protein n=1 Tax=Synaphobranchus kaupii TaxID=118154 RepID=A0A9Q1GF88_SYNKA|nr:hypothetical protein SKAU_G00038530 [Synaphobranchus kaupii]